MVANVGGGVDLGSAYGKIIITDNIGEAIGRAQNALQGFGGQLSQVGGAITTLTAPLVALGAVGLSVASNFDTVMRQIQVFGGVTGDELEAVRQTALKFGADTKFSAQDAANAMLDLLKAGQNLQETLATMPAVLNLAGAGGINLAQSAGIVTTALAQFQLGAEEAGRVADALAQAANASRAEVSDLGLAMVNVGPTAAQFGLSVEDTAAALAVLANNGILGAEAGTQLRTMLSQLARPTADNEKAFAKLNIALYDSQGRVRPLGTLLQDLKGKLSALPMEDQIQLTNALAGAYGSTALRALLASDGIDEMLAAMNEAPGAATVAGAFMDTFAGKAESLRGSIETLMIEAMTPFMNQILGPLVDQLIPVVNSIAEWAAANPELTKTIISLVGAAAGLGATLWTVGHIISAVGTLIGALTSPIGLIIAALAAFGIAYETNFLGFRDTVDSIVSWIGGAINTIKQTIAGLSTFFEELGAGASFQEAARKAFEWFPDFEVSWNNFWKIILPDAVKAAAAQIGIDVDAISEALSSAWTWLSLNVFDPLKQTIDNFVMFTWPQLVSAVEDAWNKVKEKIEAVWNFLRDTVFANFGTALSNLRSAFGSLKDAVEIVWPGIQKAIEVAWKVIQPILQSLLDKLLEIVGQISILEESSGRIANLTPAGMADLRDYFGITIPGEQPTPRTMSYPGQYGRQFGGSVLRGLGYLVGERGPEVFVPQSSGNIIPNSALSGDTYNVTVMVPEVALLTPQAARENGEIFGEAFMERMRARGN